MWGAFRGKSNKTNDNNLSIRFSSKPFGLKLKPADESRRTGAYVFKSDTPRPGLVPGMRIVTIGTRNVLNEEFSIIVSLLGQVRVPVNITFTQPAAPPGPPPPQNMPFMQGHSSNPVPYGVPTGSYIPAHNPPPNYSAPNQNRYGNNSQPPSQPWDLKPANSAKVEDMKSPPVSDDVFHFLDGYSISDLDRLLADRGAIEDLAEEKVNITLKESRKSYQREVKMKAEANLAHREGLESKRRDVEVLRAEIVALKASLNGHLRKQEEILNQFSRSAIQKMCTAECNKAESESEAIRDKFEDDSIAYMKFIKDYKAARSQYHRKCVVKEAFIRAR